MSASGLYGKRWHSHSTLVCTVKARLSFTIQLAAHTSVPSKVIANQTLYSAKARHTVK